ncbi:hypothetical protein [Occallatibacter savannae]|uniref:hypothetical protein n=1 Tax=Occallatibacter savannae TaxID=1002691 RepID=UPI000D69E691|nr:hypothetical protein [Occallatibacter savannae]
MTASPQLLVSRVVSVLVLFAALNATSLCGASALALEGGPLPHVGKATLVIFTDHAMDDEQWSALVRELQRADVRLDTSVRELGGGLEVLRGRDLKVGIDFAQVISVQVVGDCTLLPGPRRAVNGALGWVKKVGGEIQPFIHVSCERIVEMLRPIALGMDLDRRDTVMAEAMARVIAHEWIHVATQNSRHEKSGVMEKEFQVSDLLTDDPVQRRGRAGREKKHTSGF